jgi:Enoyl-CoA hydratase/isomerase
MPFAGSPVYDVKAAAEVLHRADQGWAEVRGALDARPLLVVDLSTGGDVLELVPAFPAVVVGVGGGASGGSSPGGVDVALTDVAEPPAPWVGVPDIDAELDVLAEAAGRSPVATTTLAQVLRLGGRHGLGHDLVVESLAYSTLQGGPEFRGWLAGRPPRPPPPAAGPERAVVVERAGDRLDVTLNRPRVRNAYSTTMRDQLCEALAVASADPSIGAVHLRGEGPDFCSGGDLDEFGALADPATAHLVRTVRSAARLLGVVGDRVVAHLHGACVGAGTELPALAGRVVAAPDTRLQLPEVAMGLIPGAGGTAALPRRIGRHRTAWMALTGHFVDAATAHRWGLVDEVAVV